jgi:hypothetical protein
MVIDAINSIFVAIEASILAFVANRLLVKRFHPYFIYATFIGVQVIRSLSVDGEVWFGSALNILSLVFVITTCYRRETKKKTSLFFVYCAITVCCELTIYTTLYLFVAGREYNELLMLYIASALHKLLLAWLAFLYLKIHKAGFYTKEWFKYLPYPIAIFFAMLWYINTSLENPETYGHLLGLGILGFMLCIFVLGYVQYKGMQRRVAEELRITKKHERDRKHYKEDEAAIIRHHDRMAHNMQFHMECMTAMPTIEDVREYSARVLKLREFNMKITGNNDVDCILWSTQQRAEEKRIGFNVTGTLPERIDFLDRIDIVTILGNGLANAIDACEKIETGDKYINVVFRFDKQFDIRIDNTFVEEPVPQKFGWFKSSKKDPGHGLGMESIEEAVQRYDGHVYTVIEDG